MNVLRGSGRAVDLRVCVYMWYGLCSLWNVPPYDTAGLCSFLSVSLSMGIILCSRRVLGRA